MATCVQCGERFTPASRGRRRRYCSRSCQARAYRARAKPATDQLDSEGTQRPGAEAASRAESARPDTGLSTQRIVAVAVRIADAHGLDALSMRQVGAELGVATMSLYHHVRGKDELVELMVGAVFRESANAADAGRSGTVRNGADPAREIWRDELETWTRREWNLLSRHRWVLRVLTDFPPPLPPGLLSDVERVLAALVDAGMDPITAHSALQCASGLVEGLALLQAGTAKADRRGLTDRWRTTEIPAILERIGAEDHPLQSTLATSLDATLDVDQMLEFGLDRLLDGIALYLTGNATQESAAGADPSAP